MPRASACTSPKPFSQRAGSGTFRPVTDSLAASTVTSPLPTLSSSGPPPATPPNAAHILVEIHVGRARRRRSGVQRTGEQVEPGVHTAAARERLEPGRSTLLVTTGSLMIGASTPPGTKYLALATAARASIPASATAGLVSSRLKKYG
jgi:hypothetical protein